MRIQTFRLGELQTNCYLVSEDKDCILIDPADDASFLLEEISRQNLQLHGMLATHGHFDHVMASGEIQLSMEVPLYISKKDAFLLKRLKETAKHFLGYEPYVIVPHTITDIDEGKHTVGKFQIQVFETPGHTPGGCCFYFPEEQLLFTGDTIFKQAVGRTDLSYSSKEDLSKSLKKILRLPVATVIYPGHGEETTILSEQQNVQSP